MGKLCKAELIVLAQSDGEQIDPSKAANADTLMSLQGANICDVGGRLTDFGQAAYAKVKARESEFQVGIPVGERILFDPDSCLAGPASWFTTKVNRKAVVTNKHLVYFGKPHPKMWLAEPKKGVKQKIHGIVMQMLKGTDAFVEVVPTLYQIEYLGGWEVVWLENKEHGVKAALQATYYDFLVARRPEAKFYAEASNQVVVLREESERKGVNGAVAFVMPFINSAFIVPATKVDHAN